MWPHLALWFGLCALVGGTIYTELVRADPLLDASDDPLSDAPEGDWPALPQDLKVSRFHGERNTL